MLVKRIASSAILIAISAVVIFNDWLSVVVITALIILGLHEFFRMLERKGINVYKYFGLAIGTIIPLSIMFRFELTKGWELLFIALSLLFLITMQFKRQDSSGAIVAISTTIFGILYVSWFLSFLIKLRYLENGIGLLASVLIITKLGDVGAYLIGSRFGKTPLIPRISPKKSVEGSIAGLLFSILGAFVCKAFLPFSYPALFIIGAFLGVVGQLGDLSESLMKRDCQVKDSSSLVPGFGGVLDLIDSLLFTGPVFYFLISNILK